MNGKENEVIKFYDQGLRSGTILAEHQSPPVESKPAIQSACFPGLARYNEMVSGGTVNVNAALLITVFG